MARKPPPVETRFKPGQSGNPTGKAKVPDEFKESRKLNQAELERAVNKFLFADRQTLQDVIKTPGTPMIEIIVASIMAQAAHKGDQQRLDFILTRILGRPVQQVQIGGLKPFVIESTGGEKILELGAKETE